MREAQKDGQFKLDMGKARPWRGLLQYFPRALRAVAEVSGYGFEKYQEWGGWKKLADANARYEDALARHQLDMARGETFDPESELRHSAHRAWNALATLELALIEAEKVTSAPQPVTVGKYEDQRQLGYNAEKGVWENEAGKAVLHANGTPLAKPTWAADNTVHLCPEGYYYHHAKAGCTHDRSDPEGGIPGRAS